MKNLLGNQGKFKLEQQQWFLKENIDGINVYTSTS